jgi:hypothetical protein
VDFGLARQRETDMSVMASVVGTLTYSCPELIQVLASKFEKV